MASCEQIKVFLQAYADGELSEEGHILIEEHLASCPKCRSEFFGIKTLNSTLLRVFEQHRLNDEFAERVLRRLPQVEFEPVFEHSPKPKQPTTTIHALRGMPQTRRRSALVAVASVILALYLGLIWYIWSVNNLGDVHRDVGKVADLHGVVSAEKKTESGQWENAPVSDRLFTGVKLRTETNSGLDFVLNDKSAARLDTSSEMLINGERNIELLRGEIYLDVAKGRNNELFNVRTPHGTVVVHGTKLYINSGAERTEVAVIEGTVTFESSESHVEIYSGQKTIAAVTGHQPAQPVVERIPAQQQQQISRNIESAMQKARNLLLARDTGISDGFVQLAEGRQAFGIRFDPAEPVTISGIKVFGRGTGELEDLQSRVLHLYLYDAELRQPLRGVIVRPMSAFSQVAEWVSIEIPPIEVSKPFYIVLVPERSELSGIETGYCTLKNLGIGERSGSVVLERQTPALETERAFTEILLPEKNLSGKSWMIRVVAQTGSGAPA